MNLFWWAEYRRK